MSKTDYNTRLYEKEYQNLFKTAMTEHFAVFEARDVSELDRFMDLIVQADRIFCMGVGVAVVTGSANQITPGAADFVLFVPAKVFNGTDSRVVESVQPMGNLFEQHLYLLFDIIVIILERGLKLSHEAMKARHRNVE